MMISNPSTTFAVALSFALGANVSAAAPLIHGANALVEGKATLNLVEQVHGTHRACVRGWVHRWGAVRWHHHVGLAHVPVRC
jgi:hypothetical protein